MCFFVRTFKSISALTKLSHAGRKFYAKMFAKDYSPILKYRSHRLYTKIFINTVYNSSLSADMDFYNMRMKNGYCVNLPQRWAGYFDADFQVVQFATC